MIELLLWVSAGIVLGVFAGLLPGIHPNTLSVLAVGFVAAGNVNVAMMLVAMAIVNSFVGFVPALYLGVPDTESYAAVMPGHRFVMDGNGNYALKLTIIGGLFGGIVALGIAFFFVKFLEKFQNEISAVVGFAILYVLVAMVFEGKNLKEMIGIFAVIALAGIFGLIVMEGGIVKQPLFLLVTGFFGVSSLIYSMKNEGKIATQKIELNKYGKKDCILGGLISAAAGAIVAMLPSLGPSEAVFLLNKIFRKFSIERYMIIIGGLNTSNMIFSFFALYQIGKTRTGIAAALKEIINVGENELLMIVAVAIIALGIGAILTELIGIRFVKVVENINYRKLGLVVLAFLGGFAFLLEGLIGLIVMATAAMIGLFAQSSKVRKSSCMAFLMVPMLLFYFLH